ncbi:MAG TPA: hypothetical protein DD611_01120 [Alphaproteobacteria bacterium]|nr:hypothetical protein [Alphaproteobacteria bacterium]
MTQVTVDFYKRIKISAIALACAIACADAFAAPAVVQRNTVTTRTAPRVSIASRMPTMSANITSSANANNNTTASDAKADDDTTAPSEPEQSDTADTTTDDVVITDKSEQFASAVSSSGTVAPSDSSDTELAEQIRRQRAALDAADTTNTANASATKSSASGQNACDATLRACMKNKCGNDFTKCSGDTDTTWGTKMDACRRDTECTGNEYKLFATEIKADRDLNALLASYNKILDCGNRYNKCITNQCGNTYSKCLGKSAGDNAISACASIADECRAADSGLASRTMGAFATLRQVAEVQVQSDEKRLYALRDQMATVCKRLGAMFDERSLDCVYTVNFWAGDSDVPYASKKAYAGSTFDCDQNWFGIDITTFKENAYRLTRSQKSATTGMLGAGVGVATGAITSGAIGRAIDTQKAKNALKDAEKEQAEINDKAASSSDASSKSETASDTKTDATSDKKSNTESVTTSDSKTDTTRAVSDRKLNRTLRKAERQASKDIDKEIADAENAELAAIENEKLDLSSDTLNVQKMETPQQKYNNCAESVRSKNWNFANDAEFAGLLQREMAAASATDAEGVIDSNDAFDRAQTEFMNKKIEQECGQYK